MKTSMSTLIAFIKQAIRKEQPVLLGRWSIDYNKKIMNIKIDSGNYDHCSGQYKYTKKPKSKYILN